MTSFRVTTFQTQKQTTNKQPYILNQYFKEEKQNPKPKVGQTEPFGSKVNAKIATKQTLRMSLEYIYYMNYEKKTKNPKCEQQQINQLLL